MRKVLLIVLLMLVSKTLPAYESDMLNLKTPTSLTKGQGEIIIQHRFYGAVNEEPLNRFFGMDTGANVALGFRKALLPNFELTVSRIRSGEEITLGAGYAYSIPKSPLRGQIEAQFFSYKKFNFKTNSEERVSNVFGLLSLQSEPAYSRITPVVDIGYDGDNKKFGAGLGLNVTIVENLGMVRKISVLGEYFPTKGDGAEDNSFAFGFRIETYGHDFDFILNKNSEIGLRHLMQGTTGVKGLRFGFNIRRMIGE